MFKVDYLSWTLKDEGLENEPSSHKLAYAMRLIPAYMRPDHFEVSNVRRSGFDWTLAREGMYMFIARDFVLFELTGMGCSQLEGEGTLMSAIKSSIERCTRVDVAHDIETEVRPSEFVKSAQFRHTSRGTDITPSGDTEYVGSRKSDRSCKVYRWNPPHPRYHLLRIEYTYRREQARILVSEIANGTPLKEICRAIGASYNWAHECYNIDNAEPIKAWRPERRTGKTVAWIYSQCVPAIGKLIAGGIITEDEILEAIRSAANGN